MEVSKTELKKVREMLETFKMKHGSIGERITLSTNCRGCTGSCFGTCRGSCSGKCKGLCSGTCKGQCSSTCKGGCRSGCKGSCSGTAKKWH